MGKGTGFVLLGFLTGLALGPPLKGISVDQLGTNTPGWIGAAELLGIDQPEPALLAELLPEGRVGEDGLAALDDGEAGSEGRWGHAVVVGAEVPRVRLAEGGRVLPDLLA